MDLFEHTLSSDRSHMPLAARMRPQTITEVVGHQDLLGPGGLITKLLATGSLPSLLLWGPPGTGKTTIGRLLADAIGARFSTVSAVSGGVSALRDAFALARRALAEHRRRTVLFVDEIHRFSKSQQDSLLPAVESGDIILIGATTENPGFEINRALLSRLRVLRMERLTDDDLSTLIDRATGSTPGVNTPIGDDAKKLLIQRADGDARSALFTLEIAAGLAGADQNSKDQPVITAEHVNEAISTYLPTYNKTDEHFALASALIKSMRASDADASVYWLTRMLEGGEDVSFVARRMVIFASEDVGNADPMALILANASAEAARLVGMPEASLPLTQCALYLARAPKSNAALKAYANSRRAIKDHGALPVPAKLRNPATAQDKVLGYGSGYRYPHNFAGTYEPENMLPDELDGLTLVDSPDDSHSDSD